MRRAGRGTLYALYSLDDIAELWICAGLICTYVELEDKKGGMMARTSEVECSFAEVARPGTSGCRSCVSCCPSLCQLPH